MTLNIYIDESGDFGFSKGSSELYIVSFVAFENKYNIESDINYLGEKLNDLGYKGMIHTALLVARKNEYNKFDLKKRKSIFYSLFNFARRVPIKFKSVIIDKRYINTRYQLNKKLEQEIEEFINNNYKYLNSFDEIVIYYDNGQDSLGFIINKVFRSKFNNINQIVNFNHEKEILFQLADMLTVIDKFDYKYKKKITLTKSEKILFMNFKIKKLITIIKNKKMQ